MKSRQNRDGSISRCCEIWNIKDLGHKYGEQKYDMKNEWPGDFLGGAVVKNPPASAGDTGLSPGPGRSHMSRSN